MDPVKVVIAYLIIMGLPIGLLPAVSGCKRIVRRLLKT